MGPGMCMHPVCARGSCVNSLLWSRGPGVCLHASGCTWSGLDALCVRVSVHVCICLCMDTRSLLCVCV